MIYFLYNVFTGIEVLTILLDLQSSSYSLFCFHQVYSVGFKLGMNSVKLSIL